MPTGTGSRGRPPPLFTQLRSPVVVVVWQFHRNATPAAKGSRQTTGAFRREEGLPACRGTVKKTDLAVPFVVQSSGDV